MGKVITLRPDGREHLAQGLKHAFPLPESGAFDNLLWAINDAEKNTRR